MHEVLLGNRDRVADCRRAPPAGTAIRDFLAVGPLRFVGPIASPVAPEAAVVLRVP